MSASIQDHGHSSGVVSTRSLFYPGGIQVGNIKAPGGKISHPQVVAKSVTGTIAASELVNSLIIVSNNAAGITLSIPNVEDILTAFAASGQTFKAGDKFEVNVARFFDLVNVGTATLAALAAAPGKHAVTFASTVDPVALTASLGATTHFAKLIFSVDSLVTPAISVFSVVG